MECPVCGGRNTKVVDSRDSRDGVRRRRVCNECGHRFTTRERIDETLPIVLKRTGERQPFDRSKIRRGLDIACRKRGIPSDALDRIVTQIETWASTRGDRELSSEALGERIMHHLYALDQVAYVRFVSVYRSFDTIDEFEHLLREMQKAERVNIEGQRTLFPELGSDADDGMSEASTPLPHRRKSPQNQAEDAASGGLPADSAAPASAGGD
ncbi:Ribonucleotide reductase transcriptional regulator NrdR [Enhygromyxa salina]|uniref:Transcriptional repressor NrdR n=1 Tax=Enhygromyxa salina TaxID=215803 RepID=A0A0C2A492_9BACT|nr:transcriptional regulator NrdR [Enhygromyxa salina]KIG18193.1 Ribonucleotide reductase transcriptional regulator NrdR [Enhygromyxa salina]